MRLRVRNQVRHKHSPVLIAAAALAASLSLSGAIHVAPAPISIRIPSPFASSASPDAARGPARRWLAGSEPLAAGAPRWARRLYSRSLLVLRNLTDPATGALIAGARDGWGYVWPRDAAAGAIALAAAGHRDDARRTVAFLAGLDLGAAARFESDGDPVPGRPAAGDAAGWVNVAAAVTGVHPVARRPWSGRQDYGENSEGDLLGNAIAGGAPAAEISRRFSGARGLVREPGTEALDSAAAWAVVPFARRGLWEPARRTLLALAAGSSRFGIGPTEDWTPGEAWTAPTAWSAWTLQRLGERRAAGRLLEELHRAETPAGTLPERVSTGDGRPLSTAPLVWSHAFAALALLERYRPPR
jgi:hypothetical protein